MTLDALNTPSYAAPRLTPSRLRHTALSPRRACPTACASPYRDLATNEKLTLKEQIARLVSEVENARRAKEAGAAALESELAELKQEVTALRSAAGGLKAALAAADADRKAALEAQAKAAGGAAARLAAAEQRVEDLELEPPVAVGPVEGVGRDGGPDGGTVRPETRRGRDTTHESPSPGGHYGVSTCVSD